MHCYTSSEAHEVNQLQHFVTLLEGKDRDEVAREIASSPDIRAVLSDQDKFYPLVYGIYGSAGVFRDW